MDEDKDPRLMFVEYIVSEMHYLEDAANQLSAEYISEAERLRKEKPSRRLSGVYLAVRREARNGHIYIDWRQSRYVDNSPLAMRASGRNFVKSRHVHRCPSPDMCYTKRNIKTATRYGADWEYELVWEFERRAAVLRRHVESLLDLKKAVMGLSRTRELLGRSSSSV